MHESPVSLVGPSDGKLPDWQLFPMPHLKCHIAGNFGGRAKRKSNQRIEAEQKKRGVRVASQIFVTFMCVYSWTDGATLYNAKHICLIATGWCEYAFPKWIFHAVKFYTWHGERQSQSPAGTKWKRVRKACFLISIAYLYFRETNILRKRKAWYISKTTASLCLADTYV